MPYVNVPNDLSKVKTKTACFELHFTAALIAL